MPIRMDRLPLMSAAIIMAAAMHFSAQSATLAFGPAIVLAENIKPGAPESDIFGKGDFTFVIYNHDKESGWYNLGLEKPTDTKELPYPPIPDPSWCRLDVSELEVKGETNAKVHLLIKVPDKPEYYNRKWTVLVVCAPGRKQKDDKPAVGLRVASRVLIETVSKVEGDPAEPAVALWPTVLQSGAIPSAFIDETVKVKNNTDAERTYTTKRMDEYEKDAEKFERYYSRGFSAIVKTPWIKSEATFKLKPGEIKDLKVDIKVPDATGKGNYEELLFVQDDKGNVNFLRVQVDVPPPTTAEKKP